MVILKVAKLKIPSINTFTLEAIAKLGNKQHKS